jgi:hypothetical protein
MRNNKMDLDKLVADCVKTKEIDFRGNTLTLRELSYGQVAGFSELGKDVEDVDAFEGNKKAMGAILRAGIVEMEKLTEEQLDCLPPVALRELNEAVLEFNGLNVANEEAGNA